MRFELNSEGRHLCWRGKAFVLALVGVDTPNVISISLSLFVISQDDYAKSMLSCLFLTFLVTDNVHLTLSVYNTRTGD